MLVRPVTGLHERLQKPPPFLRSADNEEGSLRVGEYTLTTYTREIAASGRPSFCLLTRPRLHAQTTYSRISVYYDYIHTVCEGQHAN